MLQREESNLCEELKNQVLYHRKKDRVPCYRLARGLQAVAIEFPRQALGQGVQMPLLNKS